MNAGETHGTEQDSTVEGAAKVFMGLLSQESTPPQRKTPQPPPAPQGDEPEDEEEAPQPEGSEASEPEADAEGESQPDEPEPEDDPQEPARYAVPGSDEQVTLDEALKGYSRTADYTRKTQALAAERKKFEMEERPALREERKQLAEQYRILTELIDELSPKEPDWETLRREAPERFAAEWAAWDQQKKAKESVAAQRRDAERRAQESFREEHAALIAHEKEMLLAAVPDWADATKRDTELTALFEYGKSIGFSEEQLREVQDHRAILLLRKARAFDEAEKKKPDLRNKIERVVRPAAPGAAKPARKDTQLTTHKRRLAQTGRVKDAAGVFFELLQSED